MGYIRRLGQHFIDIKKRLVQNTHQVNIRAYFWQDSQFLFETRIEEWALCP
jgi:hypothetical protein